MKAGSLCTGYSGLEAAASKIFDLDLRWVADNDEGSRKLLEYHHPGVINLGDITQVDFTEVEPVDILLAGFPCTDVSLAGMRRGLRKTTRTGLWYQIARAIDVLRPSLVFLENVNGLRSGEADSDVERCPWCMGDRSGDVVLRAFGAVLGDLATLGFDAEWTSVYAADVGAPHRRERVFIFAWPADTASDRLQEVEGEETRGGIWSRSARGDTTAANAGGAGRDGTPGEQLPDGEPASSDFFAAYAEHLGLDAA